MTEEVKKKPKDLTPEAPAVVAEKPRSPRQILNDRIEQQRKEESRIVKGRFQCFEPVGGTVTFSFKKYKNDPVASYTMKDGEVYEVPLAVARHLNANCKYPVNQLAVNSDGSQRTDIGKWVPRMSFTPLEFDVDSAIVQSEQGALAAPR